MSGGDLYDQAVAAGFVDCLVTAYDKKHPITKWEPFEGRHLTPEERAEQRALAEKTVNCGFWSPCGGPHGFVAFDPDDKAATQRLIEFASGDVLARTASERTPGGGWHFLFGVPEDDGLRNNGSDGVGGTTSLHFRALGGGIKHWPSAGYVMKCTPIQALEPLSESLRALVLSTNGKGGSKTPAADIPETIAEGQRNKALASLAGSMRRRGAGETAIEVALLQMNTDQCRPPLAEDEVRKIAGSIATRYTLAVGDQHARPDEHVPDEHDGGAQHEVPAGPFNLTELGNAERMAARHKGRVSAVRGHNLMAYDPRRGIFTADRAVLVRYATKTVRSIYGEAAECSDENTRTKIGNHARLSESRRAIDAMLYFAESLESLEAEIRDFDASPELLNVTNGVVDLRTGTLSPHSPDFRMTKVAGAAYHPEAPCPVWLAHLARIFEGDAEMIGFLQDLFGYAMTGLTVEQIFATFYGGGGNGKGKTLNAFGDVLGGYTEPTSMTTFSPQRSDAIRNDLAGLAGARLVPASEIRARQPLDESIIKQLTGDDPITCRFLKREFFTYRPQFLIILSVNHKPRIDCADYAIRRRVLLVPFDLTIPETERDRNWGERLRAELDGILTWGVQGAVRYLASGLRIPEKVRAATDAYRAEMDPLHQFWNEGLVFGEPGVYTTAKALRDALETWAAENGVDSKDLPHGSEWGRQLHDRGARRDKRRLGNTTASVWYGVRIVGEDAQDGLI